MWHFSIHDGSQWQPVNQFLRMSALVRSSTMLTKHMSTCSRTCEGREGTNRNIVRPDAGEPRFCPPKHAHWWAASSRADRWAFGRPQIPLASKDLESCELHSNSSWEDKQSCCCLVLGEKSSLDSSPRKSHGLREAMTLGFQSSPVHLASRLSYLVVFFSRLSSEQQNNKGGNETTHPNRILAANTWFILHHQIKCLSYKFCKNKNITFFFLGGCGTRL